MKDGAVVHITYMAGNCPVQAEGSVNGKPFYFRARGDAWAMSIGDDPVSAPEWRHEEFYGKWPDAGWMGEDVAKGFILKCANMFDRGEAPADLSFSIEHKKRLAAAKSRTDMDKDKEGV